MAARLQQDGHLYQRRAAREITERFGEAFTYLNDRENLCINKHVLKAFREATGDTAEWVGRARYWRKRAERKTPDDEE
jgi:Family of unknown function (DUF6953)